MSDEAAIRRANLRSLKLTPAELVRRGGRSNSYWRDLMVLTTKSFGERAARSIEQDLELPRGWLDTPAPQPGATRGPVPAPTVLPTLPQALQALLGTVSGLSGMRLTMARAALHQLVDHPEMLDDAAEQLAHLVAAETAARSKRSSAA